MDRMTCIRTNQYANLICTIHNGFGPRNNCPREHEPNTFCKCCWDYLLNPESRDTGYCVSCRRKPEHQRPPALTARSVWTS